MLLFFVSHFEVMIEDFFCNYLYFSIRMSFLQVTAKMMFNNSQHFLLTPIY